MKTLNDTWNKEIFWKLPQNIVETLALACWSLVWWWWWWRYDPHLITFRASHSDRSRVPGQLPSHQPVVAAHFLQIIDLCEDEDVWTLSLVFALILAKVDSFDWFFFFYCVQCAETKPKLKVIDWNGKATKYHDKRKMGPFWWVQQKFLRMIIH